MRLVRDAAFQEAVQDIVIEFASRNNQPLLDRYTLARMFHSKTYDIFGGTLPKWRHWESPIYAEWLAAIREVNKGLVPRHKKATRMLGYIEMKNTPTIMGDHKEAI